MKELNDDHQCPWRDKAEELIKRIEQLERMLFGKRSEKMPSLKNGIKSPPDQKSITETRQERRALRQQLPEVRVEHPVKDADKQCPKCGCVNLKKLGGGKESTVIEYVPARLLRQVHVQETLACPCGEYVVTADGPIKPVEGGHYGPAFIANIVTGKCVDSMPLYRMEKQLKRAGLPLCQERCRV